jgi:hypothetical protein
MTNAELNVTATCITALASEPNATEKIKMLLQSFFTFHGKDLDGSIQEEKKAKSISSKITFSQKEVSKMDKTFRKEFIANGLVAHILKRQRGKNSALFEIRYRRGGYDICATAADLEEAKRRFLKLTTPEEIEKHRQKKYKGAKNSFRAITTEWLEFKKGKIDPRTHKNYESYCVRYLYPVLGDLTISQIKTIDKGGCMKIYVLFLIPYSSIRLQAV